MPEFSSFVDCILVVARKKSDSFAGCMQVSFVTPKSFAGLLLSPFPLSMCSLLLVVDGLLTEVQNCSWCISTCLCRFEIKIHVLVFLVVSSNHQKKIGHQHPPVIVVSNNSLLSFNGLVEGNIYTGNHRFVH